MHPPLPPPPPPPVKLGADDLDILMDSAMPRINITWKKNMLDNFMELVFAMVVGTSRKHIAATIERYHQIQGVVQRSEGSFGSVHAWRAFTFERYNYLLQQENTNNKFGEMELTFMCHTCRSANLCPILADPSLREELEEMVNKYHQYANEDCQDYAGNRAEWKETD
ncbi:hypothetical protein EV424DRAFT_1349493 [Suillus variegatus]|nr:hypothetical protein EV424DRAFT_1349493 [Suillus variegatus]